MASQTHLARVAWRAIELLQNFEGYRFRWGMKAWNISEADNEEQKIGNHCSKLKDIPSS